MSPPVVRIATRKSRLALAQTDAVIAALQAAHPDRTFERVVFTTKGDRILELPLPALGGKGVFTAELEAALSAGDVDMAVHSVKDLPVEMPEGFELACVPGREDPRDVLVSRGGEGLAELPAGSRVGTSSPRRQAQVRRLRADLEVVSLRGNVETRLRKVREGDCDAAVLAAAGLLRLGLEAEIAEWVEPDRIIPAAGQGAIGVEIRSGDRTTAKLLAAIDRPRHHGEVTAERQVLRAVGGGCRTPVGAHAAIDGEEIRLRAGVFSPDGGRACVATAHGVAHDAALVAKQVADELIAQGAVGMFDRESS